MKNLIHFSLLALFTIHYSLFTLQAQGVWSPRSPLPLNDSAMFQGISGFSIGNYGYAGLGNWSGAGIVFDDLLQFDPSNDSWTKKAIFPGKIRVAPASFVIGDTVYLATGSISNGGACITECWKYDPNNDNWTQKADFPGSARTYATGFAIDSVGYVGLGSYEDQNYYFYRDFYAYHPSTNTWTQIADFPGIVRESACGFGVNGKGYVGFGLDTLFGHNTCINDWWEYDPGTDAWTQKQSYPGEPIAAQGFSIDNNIYIGIGDASQGLADWDRRFWVYNTLMDIWGQETSFPGIKTIQGVVFSIGDTGYYGFGSDSMGTIINEFYKFYPDTSLGINEVITYNTISIYPNPFITSCSILLPIIDSKILPVITLINIQGQNIDADLKYSNPYYIIYRGKLNAGMYILSIKYNNMNYFKKLIITD